MAEPTQILKVGAVELPEVTVPETPASGFGRIYVKSTGLFFIGDDGVEIGPLGVASLNDISHIMVFTPAGLGLVSGSLYPNPGVCVGESGEHGTFTALRAKAIAGTAGSGTNTIVIEADDNPAFSSATTLFTLALNTSTEVDDTTLDNAWNSGDIFIRARCTAVDATEPENVVVFFYFKEELF